MDLLASLREAVGDGQVVTDPDVVTPYSQDWTRRWQGKPLAVVRPGSTEKPGLGDGRPGPKIMSA